jgi:CheY-like chemotaxis protein
MLLKNKQIFIVEDDAKNRIIFQMILLKQGARLDFERWGDGAINQLCCLERVDMIILDIMLAGGIVGGISGFQIFDKIRERSEFDKIPVVAVSAAEPRFASREAQRKGFSGFIAKPIDDILFPQQLVNILAGEQIWYIGKPC